MADPFPLFLSVGLSSYHQPSWCQSSCVTRWSSSVSLRRTGNYRLPLDRFVFLPLYFSQSVFGIVAFSLNSAFIGKISADRQSLLRPPAAGVPPPLGCVGRKEAMRVSTCELVGPPPVLDGASPLTVGAVRDNDAIHRPGKVQTQEVDRGLKSFSVLNTHPLTRSLPLFHFGSNLFCRHVGAKLVDPLEKITRLRGWINDWDGDAA